MKTKLWFVWCMGLVLYLVLAPTRCSAETKVLNWDNPTVYTDGSAIPANTLAQGWSRIYIGDSDIGPWTMLESIGGEQSYIFKSGQPIDKKWYTVQYVVPCDALLPTLDDGTNKCPSDYAIAIQYTTPAIPTKKYPRSPANVKTRIIP